MATLKVAEIAKSESFALSQSFFYGWTNDNPNRDHRVVVVHGTFIDLRDDLAVFEASGGPAKKDNGNTGTGSTGTTRTGNIDWAEVEKHLGWLTSVADLPADFSKKGKAIIAHSGNLKDLLFDLDEANLLTNNYATWSEVSLALASIFKSDSRFTIDRIAAALMAKLDCNQHITKIKSKANRHRAVERLIARSTIHQTKVQQTGAVGAPNWREQTKDGPVPSMHNARLAIVALDIECKLDVFHNKLMFGYHGKAVHILGDEVTDNGILALRQLMSDKFGFDLTERHTRDAVISLALEHCFNPVVDMLTEAEANWDKVERLDRMAVDWFNCEDTPLNAAFIRKTMIAAVARARVPGIKKDEITVLESAEGFNKSTAWRVLAGDENFSDERIIGKESREVQEHLADVWIHESADLAGMRKAEVETVKAYASRQEDNARPAYGHFLKRQKRHSIEVGTTNSDRYLQSQTGNRRFWPLRVLKAIDIEKLKRDRLQLWGEAAHYQSQGESLVLDEALWAQAGEQQEERRVTDPWEDVLGNLPPHVEFRDGLRDKEVRIIEAYAMTNTRTEERVAAVDLLTYVLKIPVGNHRTEHSMRLANTMKKLGWERPVNGYVSMERGRVKGYYRDA